MSRFGTEVSHFGDKADCFGTKPAQPPIDAITSGASDSEETEQLMGEFDTRDTAKSQARIISLAEAAKIIGTSYPTAVRLAKSGELKAFRIRKTWRTSEAACRAFVRNQFEIQALECQSVEVEG